MKYLRTLTIIILIAISGVLGTYIGIGLGILLENLLK